MVSLGIVGHAAEKFTPTTERLARRAIDRAIKALNPGRIVSGGSPMGGVDRWAEDAARAAGIEMVVHLPERHQERYFLARNRLIAQDSSHLIVVVVTELPPGFSGMAFPVCYHCKTKEHVKSGACWTAKRALELGKRVRWCYIHRDSVEFKPWVIPV